MRSWLRLVGKKRLDRRERLRGRAARTNATHFLQPAFDSLESRITPAGPSVLSIAPSIRPSTTHRTSRIWSRSPSPSPASIPAISRSLQPARPVPPSAASSAAEPSTTVTVNSVSGNGSLGLNLVNNGTIEDSGHNVLTGSTYVGPTYSIDHTAPLVQSIVRTTPAGTPSDPAYDWTGPDYVGIAFTNNTLTDVGEGFFAQFGGKGTFSGTTIDSRALLSPGDSVSCADRSAI